MHRLNLHQQKMYWLTRAPEVPPTIHACIVCEQARPELLGKWMLLGFFGVAPHVRVAIGDFNKPVTLCFVFVGDRFVGKVRAAIRVVAPNGDILPGATEAAGEFFPDKPVSTFYMHFQGPVRGPGRYAVTLIVNGEEFYPTSFELLPQT